MTFPKFGKIETLYDRDPETFKVKEGIYRRPEFSFISGWHITEKIDGTNVRVNWSPAERVAHLPIPRPACGPAGLVQFGGRTDNAQMPTFLLDYLMATFTAEKFAMAFDGDAVVTLYGEGYGPKIQKGGGNYRDDVAFRLFDVLIHGCDQHRPIWLERGSVGDIARKMGMNTVPVIGYMEVGEVVEMVKKGFTSPLAMLEKKQSWLAEGVVGRAPHGMLDRLGRRIIWKLKTKDFA